VGDVLEDPSELALPDIAVREEIAPELLAVASGRAGSRHRSRVGAPASDPEAATDPGIQNEEVPA
jgi:hypothetical protein